MSTPNFCFRHSGDTGREYQEESAPGDVGVRGSFTGDVGVRGRLPYHVSCITGNGGAEVSGKGAGAEGPKTNTMMGDSESICIMRIRIRA